MSRRDWFAEQAEIICDLYDEADELLEDYGPDKSDRFEQLLDRIECKCQRLLEDFEEQSTDPEKQTILRVDKVRVYSSLKALRNIKELYEGTPVATSFSSHWPEQMRKGDMTANIEWLAKELGPEWSGGLVNKFGTKRANLDWLLKRQQPFCAEFKEQGKVAHAVVIDGINDFGNISIRDAYNATKYEMTREEFIKFWNCRAVFRKHEAKLRSGLIQYR